MKVDRVAIAAFFALIIAFLFLVPVIGYSIPLGAYHCPVNGCQFLRYGSITYWAFGIGATMRDVRGYTLGVATTTPAISTSSSVSYTSTTSSTVSSSCSGYPPGGNCITTYNYTFTLSVNYSGPWKLTYQGYNSLGESNVSGSYDGTGFNSRAITLSGLNNSFLTLCAQAQKLDASSSTLILTITGHNETSIPYGSTSYCGGVVP